MRLSPLPELHLLQPLAERRELSCLDLGLALPGPREKKSASGRKGLVFFTLLKRKSNRTVSFWRGSWLNGKAKKEAVWFWGGWSTGLLDL